MDEVTVEAEATVFETEDEVKVERSMRNVLPDLTIERFEGADGRTILKARAKGMDSLNTFRTLLRMDRIRDAARAILTSSTSDKIISFQLNKQVAYIKHISFYDSEAGSPLGPIKIEIRCEDPKQLIDWLTATTAQRS